MLSGMHTYTTGPDLNTGRHGQYGLEMKDDIWAHEMVNRPVYRDSSGLSFINCGNDLIYAASTLYKKTGEKRALEWAKHLAYQYVRARHPETGSGRISVYPPEKEGAHR